MKWLAKLKSKDNTGIVIRNTIASIIIKGGSLVIALFTTPAYMRYFSSNEILGLWFTVLSVLAWILNCDMGIGNGLRNHLVYAINENDWDKAKRYISSAYYFLCAIGVGILCLIILIGHFVNWNTVFNVDVALIAPSVLQNVIIILLVSVILQFVLRLVTSILYALQEAFVPGLLNLITNVVMLGYVLAANRFSVNDSIKNLAYVYLIAVNLPLLLATVWVFSRKLPQARPALSFYRKNDAVLILKVGVAFLWVQLIAMVVDNTNNYLISFFVGNAQVVVYQLYNRIFFLPVTMLMLLTGSIWSTITKAKAENNWTWIAGSYKKTMLIVAFIGAGEFLMVPLLQFVFDLWLGDKTIPVNYTAALTVALSSAIMCLRTILASYSNGLCELKIQTVFMTIGAVINIPLAYLFSRVYRSYLAIVFANIISMIPFCVAQIVWCQKHIVKKACEQSARLLKK